jgi:hypothetical protein
MYRELTNIFIGAKSIVILGDIGSGKTASAFKILELCKGNRPVYFYNHPNIDLLSQFGYKNITMNEISRKQNSIIVLDEIQLAPNPRKRDIILSKMLSLSRQKDNLLIIITSDSRTLSPCVEGYIDFWVIKDYEYQMTKQRSKVRNIIMGHCDIDPDSFSLSVNEMIIYCRRLNDKISSKDIYYCDLPIGWSDKLSKSYYSVNILQKNIVKNETFVSLSSLEDNDEKIQKSIENQKLYKKTHETH